MKDRIPLYPGRVKMTPVAGQENTYDIVRADEPQQEGTPLNKANLLSDETCAAFGLGNDSVPNDVLNKLSAASLIKKVPKYTETTIGGIAVGKTIKLNVNGAAKEFIVVHHGKPSSLYDDSCSGTWLLMKDIYEKRQWHSSNVNDYANSDIHGYLNSTFLNLFDADIKAQIKTVKIPYVNGTGASAVASGSSGLSDKIFLLSGYEVGWTNSDNQYFPVDGAKLDYFTAGTETAANKKRIANLNGSATSWWLRSPYTDGTSSAWCVSTDDKPNSSNCSGSYGVRPALVLSDTTVVYVDSDGNVHDEQEYIETLTDVLGVPFASGVKIETGSYKGTGTYGANNPNTLTFEFEPKLVVANHAMYSDGGYTTIFVRDTLISRGFSHSGNTVLFTMLKTTWDGKSVSWYVLNAYSGQNDTTQLNGSGQEYKYVAIG